MSRFFVIIAFLCLCTPLAVHGQERPHITLAAALDHRTGLLQWQGNAEASYAVYRRYPGDEDFALIAVVSANAYTDTLNRVVCADTVSYYVQCQSPLANSDTAGVVYRDDVPTSPCSLKVCTTHQDLNQVLLTWYPSPDSDVMGYYICRGNPCLDYDTVWGKENCSYLCPLDLDDQGIIPQHQYRILAFDSCMQASPLTPYFRNPILQFDSTPCSRHFKCSWNRYINMPDSVGSYQLHYQLEGDEQERIFTIGSDGPFEFDMEVADLSVGHVDCYLSVENTSGILSAVSQRYSFEFMVGNEADYIAISDIQYDATLPAITLTIDIDPDFAGTSCTLYRSQGSTSQFLPIAQLPRQPGEPSITYQDLDIHRSAGVYYYHAGIWDLCHQVEKISDSAEVHLPEVLDANAYFPNAIRFGDPTNGSFYPHLASPLAEGYEMSIFNRMGERVFHTTSLSDSWDGTRQGTPLPQGVYVYRVHCHHADNTEKTYTGSIILIK